MKTMIAAVVLVVALSGVAAATEDESALTIDLSGAKDDSGVHAYFLKCQYGRDPSTGCGVISVWENTNGVTGLQTLPGAMTGLAADKPVAS